MQDLAQNLGNTSLKPHFFGQSSLLESLLQGVSEQRNVSKSANKLSRPESGLSDLSDARAHMYTRSLIHKSTITQSRPLALTSPHAPPLRPCALEQPSRPAPGRRPACSHSLTPCCSPAPPGSVQPSRSAPGRRPACSHSLTPCCSPAPPGLAQPSRSAPGRRPARSHSLTPCCSPAPCPQPLPHALLLAGALLAGALLFAGLGLAANSSSARRICCRWDSCSLRGRARVAVVRASAAAHNRPPASFEL